MSTSREAILGRVFGIAAGLANGISAVLIRKGVGDIAQPLVGAVLSMLAGTIGLFILGGSGIRSSLVESKKGIIFFVFSGLAAAGGIACNYLSLSLAPVVIVSPLASINPLFTLLWSWLFLGHMEKITPKLILGSILIVGGTILITVGRTTS